MLNTIALSLVFGMFLLSTMLAVTFSVGAGPRIFGSSQIEPTPTASLTPSPTPSPAPSE